MQNSAMVFNLGQQSYISTVVGIGKSIFRFDDGERVHTTSLLPHIRLHVDWDMDRVYTAVKVIFETAASRGRKRPSSADVAYLLSTTDYAELADELHAIWFIISTAMEQLADSGFDAEMASHLLTSLSAGTDKDSQDDNLLFMIGAFAHSRVPVYVSYSSLVKMYRIRFDGSSRTLTLERRLNEEKSARPAS